MQEFLNTTHQTVAWFRKAHDAGELEMKPPFQRNPVWVEPQKAFLIDTILRGYPVPELYMQNAVDEAGEERHVVVDGQQRLRACLEYLEGEFSLSPKDSPEWADMAFEDLTTEDKRRIYEYKFVVRLLPNLTDEELRPIFQRLNRNVIALNKQELRHATYWGEFISTMEALGENDFWTTSGIFTPNDFRRMLDVEFISELAVGILHGPQNKKLSLDKWYQVYEEYFEDQNRVEKTFGSVLGELDQVLPDLDELRWSKKSDFYTLFLTLADHVDELPLSRDDREVVRGALLDFGDTVDSYMAEETKRVPRNVRDYAKAVQRAASDLANRRRRQEIVEELIF